MLKKLLFDDTSFENKIYKCKLEIEWILSTINIFIFVAINRVL